MISRLEKMDINEAKVSKQYGKEYIFPIINIARLLGEIRSAFKFQPVAMLNFPELVGYLLHLLRKKYQSFFLVIFKSWIEEIQRVFPQLIDKQKEAYQYIYAMA